MDEIPLSFTIKKPGHFSFAECHGFLDRGFQECLYQISDSSVRRTIQTSKHLHLIEIQDAGSELQVRCLTPTNTSDMDAIETYVIDWFDLQRDLTGFYQILNQHPATSDFAQKYYGLRLMGIVDLFEVLCWCVIGQQINLTFAHKIKTRLVHHLGAQLQYEDQIYYCFPTPQSLLDVKAETLADMQFSRQKISYIKNIAQAFVEGQLDKENLLTLSAPDQIKALTQIKGIGPWTANYASMKCLRNMNCIAYGDTGLSAALHRHFETEKKPRKEVIDNIFEDFKGWESYLNFYLWRSLGDS